LQIDDERTKRVAAKYSRYGTKSVQAMKAALAGGVKEHRFIPSGRTIHTVVGREGDEFIDPRRSYCSCSHYFFRVLGGKDETCYHLLSYRLASELGALDVTTFDDAEYGQVFSTIVRDVFGVLERSSGRPSVRLD
jgi:predicted nucleic acid-binding Zn finger protein